MIEANVRLVRDLIAANPEKFTMVRFGDTETLQPPTLTKCNTANTMPHRRHFSLEDFLRQERVYRTWTLVASLASLVLGLFLGARYL